MLDCFTTFSSSSVNVPEILWSIAKVSKWSGRTSVHTMILLFTHAIHMQLKTVRADVSSPIHNFLINWLVNLNFDVADSFANYEGKDKSLWRELATCAESTLGLVGSRQSFCLEEDHYRQRHHHHHHHYHHYRVLQEVVNLSAKKITIFRSSKCSSPAFDLRLPHLLIFASNPGIEIRCYQSGMKYVTSTR